MPHVILKGEVIDVDWIGVVSPLTEETKAWRIKIRGIFIEQKKRSALLSAVVVEEGHPQSFYILVAKNEAGDGLAVRLDPSTDPIKTRGVKRSIAVVAEALLRAGRNLSIDRHNINDFLDSGVIRLFTEVNSTPD